jgi:hypothetical protein
MLKFSSHARERIYGRLAGLTSGKEIDLAIRLALREVGQFCVGETAVKIRRLPRCLTLTAADGSVSSGDILTCVYKRSCQQDPGLVTTVELRHHNQPDAKRWASVVDLTTL